MSLFMNFGLAFLLLSLYGVATVVACESLNVRVLRVAVGFGPPICDFTLGYTRFVLKLVPLGASINTEGLEWGDRPPWKRLVIAVSGPFLLILFGSLIVSLAIRLYGRPVLLDTTTVAGVSAESPAATAAVAAGDVILSIERTDVATWTELRRLVRQAGANPVDASLRRQGATLTVTLSPSRDRGTGGFLTLLSGRTVAGMEERIERHHHDSLGSLAAGIRVGASLTQMFASAFWQMVTGGVGAAAFDTPRLPSGDSGEWRLGRGSLRWDSSQRPRSEAFLWLYASVAIFFGVFNLLPVPGLNGGRIVRIVVETLSGQPLSERAKDRLRITGYSVLGILMARFIYFDLAGR